MNTINNMDSEIKVRFARIEDLEFIYKSMVTLFTEASVIQRFSQDQNSLKQAIFSPESYAKVLIGEVGGSPAGFLLWSMTNRNFTLFNGPGIYIHDLFVEKAHRRQKIATLMA